MKKFLFLFSLLLSLWSSGQHIYLGAEEQVLDSMRRPGITVTLELQQDLVDKLWKKHLKEFGKLSNHSEGYVLEHSLVPKIYNSHIQIYSKVKAVDRGTQIWMAVDLGSAFLHHNDKEAKNAKQFLHDFGMYAYKEDLQDDITAAEKALERSMREHEREVKDGENLSNDLQDNAEEKRELELALQENAAKKIEIEQQIEQNQFDQTSALETIKKMEEALNLVKEKLNLITSDLEGAQ